MKVVYRVCSACEGCGHEHRGLVGAARCLTKLTRRGWSGKVYKQIKEPYLRGTGFKFRTVCKWTLRELQDREILGTLWAS